MKPMNTWKMWLPSGKLLFYASCCPAAQQQKLLSTHCVDAQQAYVPTRYLLMRNVVFADAITLLNICNVVYEFAHHKLMQFRDRSGTEEAAGEDRAGTRGGAEHFGVQGCGV